MKQIQLALDTSASRPTVAILSGSQVLAEWLGSKEEHHSVSLLAGIDNVLQTAKLQAKDLHFISVGIGPGMFTGLRIGVATAKFFADLHNLPVAAVSSLLGLTLGADDTKGLASTAHVWAMNDARSGRVYALCISADKLNSAHSTEENEEVALTPEEILPHLQNGDLLLGEGAEIFQSSWPSTVKLAAGDLHILKARHIAAAGLEIFQKGKCLSAVELLPRYLKTGQRHLP